MSNYYNSPICRNCGRDKAALLPPGAALERLEHAHYCFDCLEHRCGEFELAGRCNARQAVAVRETTPPAYLGYCAHHLRQRTRCRNPLCRNVKEPWASYCPACRDRHGEAQSRARVARWRAEGVLCHGCKSARQHAPQRFCEPCLQARGVAPLVVPTAWREAVRELVAGHWVGPPPAEVAKREQKAKRAAYLKRERERERAAPKRKRAPGVASILKAMRNPNAEERAAAGLPKRKSYYKPKPQRVPYHSERRYKKRFWTREL